MNCWKAEFLGIQSVIFQKETTNGSIGARLNLLWLHLFEAETTGTFSGKTSVANKLLFDAISWVPPLLFHWPLATCVYSRVGDRTDTFL